MMKYMTITLAGEGGIGKTFLAAKLQDALPYLMPQMIGWDSSIKPLTVRIVSCCDDLEHEEAIITIG